MTKIEFAALKDLLLAIRRATERAMNILIANEEMNHFEDLKQCLPGEERDGIRKDQLPR